MRGTAGFTLIEVLVTIGIIALLAAIILPRLNSSHLKEGQAFAEALAAYYNATASFAALHESRACIKYSGESFIGTPADSKPLSLPAHLSVSLQAGEERCYNANGKLESAPSDIHVMADGEQFAAKIIFSPTYGNAQVLDTP